MTLKNITSSIKLIVLATLLAGGMGYIIAWTGPTATPPGGNVPAPLNVGQDSPIQEKLGGLRINTNSPIQDTVGLQVWGKTILNGGFQLMTGAGNNKVLTSDQSGNATWQTSVAQLGTLKTYVVSATRTDNQLDRGILSGSCNAGDVVTGGGCEHANGGVLLLSSKPWITSNGQEWDCNFHGSQTDTMISYAICLNIHQ